MAYTSSYIALLNEERLKFCEKKSDQISKYAFGFGNVDFQFKQFTAVAVNLETPQLCECE